MYNIHSLYISLNTVFVINLVYLVQIFPGNHDRKTSVVNKFPHHVLAKYFRLKVLAFHGWPTLRMDFMTC